MNYPDIFCCICSCFTSTPQRYNHTFIKTVYLAYFRVPLGD